MSELPSKTCPACLSSINAAASRCAHCAQLQPDAPGLHRDVHGKALGGVCSALAQHFNLDLTLMRVLFVASFAVTGPLALWLYASLWLMTPYEAGGASPLKRFFEAIGAMFSTPASKPHTDTPAA
jgi:phage shock protein PspC (stress-responsive transcriptional regulator)